MVYTATKATAQAAASGCGNPKPQLWATIGLTEGFQQPQLLMTQLGQLQALSPSWHITIYSTYFNPSVLGGVQCYWRTVTIKQEGQLKSSYLENGEARNQVYFQGGDILSPTLHLYTTSARVSLTTPPFGLNIGCKNPKFMVVNQVVTWQPGGGKVSATKL